MIEYLFGIVLGIIYELQPIAETHHTNDEVEISLDENRLSETEDDKPAVSLKSNLNALWKRYRLLISQV